jgi:antitoxin (DNA-binding transcriptional repressor) of toxin-antitoxin stability system
MALVLWRSTIIKLSTNTTFAFLATNLVAKLFFYYTFAKNKEDMIVSTRDFRANQTKYLNMASNGEEVILKSRTASYRIMPTNHESTKPMSQAEFEGKLLDALKQVDDHLSGVKKMLSWEELRNEL